MSALLDAYETGFAKLLYQAVALANIADNAASAPLTNIRYSLHTADPGSNEATGTQATSEAAHAPYARVSVARTTTGHGVASGVASPNANVDFSAATSGTATVSHFGNGTATSGAGSLILRGAVTPNISVAAGVTPRLTTATAITWA